MNPCIGLPKSSLAIPITRCAVFRYSCPRTTVGVPMNVRLASVRPGPDHHREHVWKWHRVHAWVCLHLCRHPRFYCATQCVFIDGDADWRGWQRWTGLLLHGRRRWLGILHYQPNCEHVSRHSLQRHCGIAVVGQVCVFVYVCVYVC